MDFNKIANIVKEFCKKNEYDYSFRGIYGFHEQSNYIGVVTEPDGTGPLDVCYDPIKSRVTVGCFGDNGGALALLLKIQMDLGLEGEGLEGEVIEVPPIPQIPSFPQKDIPITELARKYYRAMAERIRSGRYMSPEEKQAYAQWQRRRSFS